MSQSEYVTNAAWLRRVGRVDAVDEIADQFERPVARGADEFWSSASESASSSGRAPWPRSSRGWRSVGRLHPSESPLHRAAS